MFLAAVAAVAVAVGMAVMERHCKAAMAGPVFSEQQAGPERQAEMRRLPDLKAVAVAALAMPSLAKATVETVLNGTVRTEPAEGAEGAVRGLLPMLVTVGSMVVVVGRLRGLQ